MATRTTPATLGGLPVQIDYTARDYEAIRAEMLNLATRIMPEWTDRQPSDIGVTLVEAMSYVADILSYQLDRVQNESYLATAQTREAVVNMLRLIGYELQPASPASVSMLIKTNLDNVVLPAGFTVRTRGDSITAALSYELIESVQLGVAGYYCVSSQTQRAKRRFGPTPLNDDRLVFYAGRRVADAVGVSNGLPDQSFILPQSPVCIGGDEQAITLLVGSEVWEGRTSFIGTDPTDKVFIYRFLSTQEVLVTFGDGVNGAIPINGDTIIAQYRIEGGSIGNRAGVGAIALSDSVAGVEFVYNLEQPTGGTDPESLASAKKRGPLSLRAMDRCVTLGDFETMAAMTPGVGVRAARAARGDDPLEVVVYVAAQGDNPIPTGRWFSDMNAGYGALGVVGRWLSVRKPVPTLLSVEAPTPIEPYLEATVYVYPNIITSRVQTSVDAALQALFNQITDEFGEGVPLSAVIQAIENTRGVDYLNVQAFHRVPSARLINGSEDAFSAGAVIVTGLNVQTRAETYDIEFISSTRYLLRRADRSYVSGSNGVRRVFTTNINEVVSDYNLGATDVEASRYELFSLFVSTGVPLPTTSSVWRFSVDDYLGNINAHPYEIVVAPVMGDGRLDPSTIRLTYIGGI